MPVDPDDAVEREERKLDDGKEYDYDDESRHAPPRPRPPKDDEKEF